MGRIVTSLATFTEFMLEDLTKSAGSTVFFRGHASREFDLTPGLFRNPSFDRVEDKIFKDMLRHHPREFAKDTSALACLVRMQHFYAPTRLLDLTESAFVALYFACQEPPADFEGDPTGEVLAISTPNDEVCHFSSDTVSILANLASRPYSDKVLIQECIEWAYAQVPTGEWSDKDLKKFNEKPPILRLLHDIRQEKPHFLGKILPESLRRTLCVRVQRNNERILAQHGAFLLFGLGPIGNAPSEIPETWNPTSRTDTQRLLIPQPAKAEIRNQLEKMMIRKDTLFPGLETTAEYLKLRYREE